jgi:hypothetical protein
MLVIEESVADRPDLQGAYFDGSLELLRELAVTIDLDTALPRLSAIVSKMLPHDALRMACFDERGQLVVNASTPDVPEITTCDGEDVIIDDLRTRELGASAAPHAPERVQDKIGAELRMVGLEHFGEMIAERMTLLEVLAVRFNNDSRIIRRLCLEVMDRIASTLEPSLRSTLDAASTRDMSIAAYLHDIGKSGPFDASQESQKAVVKLYAVENVADPDQTIAKTVRMNFSFEEAESILDHLSSCGLRSTDTMRTFWDRHGYWTHDILEADSEDIPSRARVVAGSHHMDRGIDPYKLSSGDYVAMLENRILMAVDKYQAAVARGQKAHGEAMNVIKKILSPKYDSDVMMNHVLEVLDAIGKDETLLEQAA